MHYTCHLELPLIIYLVIVLLWLVVTLSISVIPYSLVSTYQNQQGSYKPMQALIRPLSTLVCAYGLFYWCKMHEWNHGINVVKNESLVKVWESKEGLNVMVISERARWKTSMLSILWIQANAAALTRAIFGASGFRDSPQRSEISFAREVEASKGRDISDELGACGVASNEILPSTQSINRL